MNLRQFYSVLLAMFMCTSAYPQSAYCWLWNKPSGAAGDAGGKHLVKHSNYIYNSGVFSNPSITFNDSVYANAGGQDVFFVKRDLKGNELWAKTLGGPMNETVVGMAVDAAGNLYLGGTFSGSLTGESAINSNGEKDIYII
ncbi:MAG TPA: hypothetical protein VGD17_00895, partial [Chitinophagaceae bacterium]